MSAPFEMPQPAVCVFCEMTAGRLDKGVVEETALTLTIVNQRQFEAGQALVISRRHAPTLLDLTEEEAAAVFAAVRKLAAALGRHTPPTASRFIRTTASPVCRKSRISICT